MMQHTTSTRKRHPFSKPFSAAIRYTFGTALLLLAAIGLNTAYGQSAPYFAWAQQLGGSGTDLAEATATDDSGNVYITGSFSTRVDFDPGPDTFELTSKGDVDIFVCKLDAKGNFRWAVRMGGTGKDAGSAITVGGDSNDVYVTGSFEEEADFGTSTLKSTGKTDIFVTKLDAQGNFRWSKSMGGASGSDDGQGIAVDKDGNVYTVGLFQKTANFNPDGTDNLTASGSTEAFLSKLDANGNYVWAKHFGGQDGYVYGRGIGLDKDGNVYTAGYFSKNADFNPDGGTADILTSAAGATPNIFVCKTDAQGNHIWAKRMGGTSGQHRGMALAVDPLGNTYTSGYFANTANFNPGSGAAANLTSSGSNDVFVVKLDKDGDYVWAEKMGGSGADYGSGVTVDDSGNVYTTGYYKGSATFGSISLQATNNNQEVFISKQDEQGDFIWAVSVGSTGDDFGRSVAVSPSGDVYAAGSFNNTVDFNPGTNPEDTFNLTARAQDGFILRLAQSPCWDFEPEAAVADPVCEGDTLKLTATGGDDYAWTGPGGFSTTDQNPEIANADTNAAGNYTVIVTRGTCTDTLTVGVTISPLPHADSIGVTKNQDGSFSFEALGAQEVDNYLWNFGDDSTATDAAPDHTYDSEATYEVTLIVSNDCGSDTLTTTVNNNNAGIASTNEAAHLLVLYPNPAGSVLHLKNESPYPMTSIAVYNILGQEVYRSNVSGQHVYSLNVQPYTSGIYTVRILLSDGSRIQSRFVIKK